MQTAIYRDFAQWISGGELHLNAWLMLSDPGVAEILAATSFDSVTFDMQHGQTSVSQMMTGIAAVALSGKPSIVRVPISDYSLCSRALDAGARAVICPMIQTAEDTRALVEATKFPPVGRRSWGAHRGFPMSGLSAQEFLQVENRSNAVFAMIETAEAVDNVESILATPGLDGIFVGPNDLCVSLTDGREVDPHHPSVEQACKQLAQAAQRHHKIAGIYANTPALALTYADYGFRFISIGSDMSFLKAQAEAVVSAIRPGIIVSSEATY